MRHDIRLPVRSGKASPSRTGGSQIAATGLRVRVGESYVANRFSDFKCRFGMKLSAQKEPGNSRRSSDRFPLFLQPYPHC